MFVVDTNIFLYAAEKTFREHKCCRKLLLQWRVQSAAWYTTWSILYEFVRVATHPQVFRKPWGSVAAWKFVEAVLASDSLRILAETDLHFEVAKQVLKEIPLLNGNVIHDMHTAVLMRENGIGQIYTRDSDFHRFPFLEVLDPLRQA